MQSQQISTMFTVEGMRKFVCDRLTEAAQEILGAFEKRAQEYELELSRQRRLLESVYSPGNSCLSDTTGPLIKEEANEVCITDIQWPVLSTRPQDIHGELGNSNLKEDENAAGKQLEVASASHQATQGSSHAQEPNIMQKTVMANKPDSPAKQVYKKCSHGYRLREGSIPKQSNSNKNNDKPVPTVNSPTAMEVIELQDSSSPSSDIEVIQGDYEPATSPKVNRELPDTACEKTPNEINDVTAMPEECVERLSQNMSNEANSSVPQSSTPALDNNQDGIAINMVHETAVDSVGNTTSEIPMTTLNFSMEHSHPPGYEENMTLPDDLNFVNQPISENTTASDKNSGKLLSDKVDKSTNEICQMTQMRIPTSTIMESINAVYSPKPTFTDLDNVDKIWHQSTDQAIKDATYNSTSLSCMRQIDTDTSSNVIDMQPVFTQRYEINIGASRVDQETMPLYGYEWKRPTQTKSLSQEGQKSAFQCDICGKVSSNFKNYKSHVKSHTTEKTFKCETCGKMFRENWDLNKHQKIHSGEKPFQCTDCGKSFNRRFNLDLHKRVHTGEKPYSCGSCDKAFTSRVNLRKHERLHTGEKPYTCEYCKKEFSDSSSLRNHQRVHTGEKPYTCSFCKKTFATRTTLKRHVRVHTGEKPYKCSMCEKSFATNTDMKVHTRIHTGEKPYKCEYCGQEFSSWTNFNRHTNIHKPKVTQTVMQ